MDKYKKTGYKHESSGVAEHPKLLTQNATAKAQAAGSMIPVGSMPSNSYVQKGTTRAASSAAAGTQIAKNSPTYGNGGYTPSDSVSQAEEALRQFLSRKPGEYKSNWQNQLNDTLQAILNKEKFSYDLNGDALYQQYKDQYTTQGKMAMMDTMGQAQAMTGGYGNSYAQSVGQQAYQGHLQQLNDKIPELYQLALNKYQMEGNELMDQYAMMAQQEERDYGRYRDAVGDWRSERDYLAGRYDTERGYDYDRWIDNRDYEYQLGRDKVEDDRWQKEFDEAKRQFDEQFSLKTGSYGSGGGGGGGGGSSGSGSGGGGGDDSGDSSPEPTQNVEDTLRGMLASGAHRNEILSYINSMYQTGEIDGDEYGRLCSIYAFI